MSDNGITLRYLRPAVALAVILTLYWLARLPALAHTERSALAARFSFEAAELPVLTESTRQQREVNPGYDNLVGWISTVGAAVAINDLDGDALPNDIVYVDPRSDAVIACPAPGSGPRFAPFEFALDDVAFDKMTMAPMGAIATDLNEDGRTDVVVYCWGRAPIAFLRRDATAPPNAGQYTAVDIAPGAGPWFTNAATLADIDGDTHADLVIGNYFPESAAVLGRESGGTPQMHDSMSRAFNGGRNRILLWAGASSGSTPHVEFKDAGEVMEENVTRGWCLAVGAADLDGDLLPELYFGHDFGPDRLLHNRSTPGQVRLVEVTGQRTLTSPGSKVIGHDSFKGMGVDFGDLNGDGYLDIYVSNIADEFALEESHFTWISTGHPEKFEKGIAPYHDLSETLGLSRSGWGWESRLADFDNDGVLEALQATGFLNGTVNRWPELHEMAMGNDTLIHRPESWHRYGLGDDLSGHQPNAFFVRASDGRYYDLSGDVGLGYPHLTRGIATADVDGDGDLDFAVANQWESSVFYENRSSTSGTFLGLQILRPGPQGNPRPTTITAGRSAGGVPAIGAVARIHTTTGVLVGEVDGGNGHSGVRSPELHFGLGQLTAGTVVAVELQWRCRLRGIMTEKHELTPGWHSIVLGTMDAVQ
jgi:hypothetical protein